MHAMKPSMVLNFQYDPNIDYTSYMINSIGKLSLFKEHPSDKIPSYKDPFRKIHNRNQEIIKKNKKMEKVITQKHAEEKNLQEIHQEKKDMALANTKYRLLNII